jgi:hypothetical protein
MARRAHDREDLLREATALVARAELQVAGSAESVVAGFRRDGSFSVFFGVDPVYQFNSARELRRAFAAGLLYKAEQGRLVGLHRERTPTETTLLRRPLAAEEQQAFLAEARKRLEAFSSALRQQRFTVTGQVPSETDVIGRLRQWLADLPAELDVAEKPHSG